VLFTEAGGKRQLIVASPKSVYSLNPETGERYWTTPYNADNGCVIMTPVRYDDYLYVGGFSSKNLLLKFTSDKPGIEVVWKDKKELGVSPVNVQPFLQDGILYGYTDSGHMYGVELPSGKRLWDDAGPVGGTPQGSGTAFMSRTAIASFSSRKLGTSFWAG
jgi:outer membrane protein assembly factor BamB